MRKIIKYIAIIAVAALGLTGCRSKQAAATDVAVEEQQVVGQWNNVQMPVRLLINQPMGISLNGTATMVRNDYIYMSFRMFGFEVAQANVTPEEFNFVMKQPDKVWFKELVGDRLQRIGLTFEKLQQIMLDDDEYSLKTTANGKTIDATLSWSRDDARWNVERPARFTAPGENYKKMTLESAKQLLGK